MKERVYMKSKILTILRNTDEYVSGQQLCEQLGVSRTAVWKAVKQLKEEGYEIDSVNNKGYLLKVIPDVMNQAEIKSQLLTKWLGQRLDYFPCLDSTNTYLKEVAGKDAPHGTVAVADRQTAGKGRLGRSWSSPTGSSVYISYLLRPDIAPTHASMLTIVAALATARAVEEITGLVTGIKWPNDIVINKRKICGILTEMSADMDRIEYVVIGIGVNVNMTQFEEEIADRATSLRIEGGKSVSRSQLIVKMLSYFEAYYEQFVKTEDLSAMLDDYNERLVNRGREVKIVERQREWQAVAMEINQDGELLVKLSDGTVKKVMSGEVSVRGIYGYV